MVVGKDLGNVQDYLKSKFDLVHTRYNEISEEKRESDIGARQVFAFYSVGRLIDAQMPDIGWSGDSALALDTAGRQFREDIAGYMTERLNIMQKMYAIGSRLFVNKYTPKEGVKQSFSTDDAKKVLSTTEDLLARLDVEESSTNPEPSVNYTKTLGYMLDIIESQAQAQIAILSSRDDTWDSDRRKNVMCAIEAAHHFLGGIPGDLYHNADYIFMPQGIKDFVDEVRLEAMKAVEVREEVRDELHRLDVLFYRAENQRDNLIRPDFPVRGFPDCIIDL